MRLQAPLSIPRKLDAKMLKTENREKGQRMTKTSVLSFRVKSLVGYHEYLRGGSFAPRKWCKRIIAITIC